MIRQSMKSITLDSLGVKRLGERKSSLDWGNVGVEGGIKAGDLWQAGKVLSERFNTAQIVGLMQRRQGIECVERLQNFGGHHHCLGEAVSSMDNTVGHGSNRHAVVMIFDQVLQDAQRSLKTIFIGRLHDRCSLRSVSLAGVLEKYCAAGLKALDTA